MSFLPRAAGAIAIGSMLAWMGCAQVTIRDGGLTDGSIRRDGGVRPDAGPGPPAACATDADCPGGACYAGVCCGGCWDGEACQSGRSDLACGSGGEACGLCPASESCRDGACAVGPEVSLSLSAVTSYVRVGGQLYSAGRNDQGQRGVLVDVTPNVFARQDTPIRFVDVATTQISTCGIDAERRLHCWGSNGFGLLGLNDGSDARIEVAPQAVGTETWIDVEGGNVYMCGIRADRRLFCWGDGRSGQLGDGRGVVHLRPTEVSGELRWTSVSAGETHTCAIRMDGALFCWGNGEAGQLGTGSLDSTLSPARVGAELDWTTVDAGVSHTCGVRRGALYCWGSRAFGRFGVDSDSGIAETPQLVDDTREWRSIATGEFHSCGVTTSDELYCFGLGVQGQLGVSMDGPLPPTRVEGRYDVLATGWTHTCAAHSADGTLSGLRCWGAGMEGQLGTGSTSSEADPAPTTVLPPR